MAATISSVLGTGVAVAADPPTCPCGNTPQAAKVAQNGAGTQQRLRKRDGTGPRHAQKVHNRNRRGGQQGQSAANRGADCPYRG